MSEVVSEVMSESEPVSEVFGHVHVRSRVRVRSHGFARVRVRVRVRTHVRTRVRVRSSLGLIIKFESTESVGLIVNQ